MRLLMICIVVLSSSTLLLAQDYNIIAYGARPDGHTLSTSFIQQAIDAAYTNGGGRVVVPAGRFLSGSIVLKSGVELHLSRGAVLLGSTDPDDYIVLSRYKALVMSDGATNIAITGHGEIDGQGRALALHIDSLFHAGLIDSIHYNWVELRPKFYLRPQLIEFVDCRNIKVTHVTLKNAASWVQTYDKCVNLLIDSVRVESDAYWNNDGIDICDSRNVRITNCYVNSADDGICLKSHYPDYFCDSIFISNCTVRSSASAVKFGTRSHGGFRNVVIENIKVFDTFRSAIAIESVDGGFLENILVENVHALNTGNAIFIRLGKRNTESHPGSLRNVTIRNLKAEIAFERPDYAYDMRGPALPFFHNIFPSSITGIPGHPVENIRLENIEIVYPGRGNKGRAYLPLTRLDEVPEKIPDYPEYSMFGELPAWGLYVRHVDGLTLKNISLQITSPDYRPAIVFDDVRQLKAHSISLQGDTKNADVILLHTKDEGLDTGLKILRL